MDWNQKLQASLDWIAFQNEYYLWFFFFFSNFLENVFPPWPGDTVTVFGGFLVAQTEDTNTRFRIWHLWTSTILGNLAGALVMYKFGHRFLNFIRYKHFPFKKELYDEEKIESTFQWFRRNAFLVIVLSRFSAGIRFFVSIVAGMVHLNLLFFCSLFLLAVLLWCGILIYGGYSLGQNWEKVLEYLEIYNRFVGVLILAFLTLVILRKFLRTGKK